MSRAVPRQNEFNKEEFARLLYEAKGDRSQTEFARECGLSVSHLNGYYNLKREVPPVPSTIQTIARNSQKRVTTEELLSAAGYDLAEMKRRPGPGKPFTYDNLVIDRFCYSQMIICLSHCGFRWTEVSDQIPKGDIDMTGMNFDLRIKIEDSEILKQWFFMIMHFSEGDNGVKELKKFYGNVSTASFGPASKISIVVSSPEEFELVKKYPPINLHMRVSVILFIMDFEEIMDEEYLQSALEIPEDLTSVFSLKDKN